MPQGYDMLAIPIRVAGGAEAWFVIEPANGEVTLNRSSCTAFSDLPTGWEARAVSTESAPAAISIHENGGTELVRLLETQSYEWAIVGDAGRGWSVTSTLEDKRRQRWSIRKREDHPPEGQFTVINHLGYAGIVVCDGDGDTIQTIPLELVSRKMDFDTEYRRMTEDIAQFCEQLLLTWDAPTSLKFSADASDTATLVLERFLFLRSFLTDEKLGRILEMIERKPHSRLIANREWKPAGMAGSTDFLSNPAGMLRSWHLRKGRRPVPGEVMDVRKDETHDTAPNRFLKFALSRFRHLCAEVYELKGDSSPIGCEAMELMANLDGVLAKRFFRDIGQLERLPLDNQTLQKGEGYREVLRAWILTEAAATLNWKGREDSYQGATRDVATLYEYWIFLKLHGILSGIKGMRASSGSEKEFISGTDGEITISLKSGESSRSRFILENSDGDCLRVDLHYERTFKAGGSATTGRSYSRNFRPDYTLSIYPARFDSEKNAEAAGEIAHLHFDAKYRVSKINQIFGDDGNLNDEGEELTEEKTAEKTESTYQRGDLLKMHTYNDALRQTIGSYVLYPGNDNRTEPMRKFHEIAPGVGALIMKPGNSECLEALEGFICDVLHHQSDRFTQYRYLSDYQHQTVSSKPATLMDDEVEYKIAKPGSTCVMIWMDAARERVFKEKGFAYCHAVPEKDNRMLEIDISVEVGAELIPYGGGRGVPHKTKDWRAKVKSAKFLTKDRLCDYLKGKVPPSWNMPSSASHYLLFEFEEAAPFTTLEVGGLAAARQEGSRYMAFTCGWNEILKSRPDLR
jgi:predicted component of viral defense system (DUF524 family)